MALLRRVGGIVEAEHRWRLRMRTARRAARETPQQAQALAAQVLPSVASSQHGRGRLGSAITPAAAAPAAVVPAADSKAADSNAANEDKPTAAAACVEPERVTLTSANVRLAGRWAHVRVAERADIGCLELHARYYTSKLRFRLVRASLPPVHLHVTRPSGRIASLFVFA